MLPKCPVCGGRIRKDQPSIKVLGLMDDGVLKRRLYHTGCVQDHLDYLETMEIEARAEAHKQYTCEDDRF